MTKQKPRRARVLTNVRVDEISVVDKGAGEGVKVVMMKRDRAALECGEPVFEPPVDEDESHDDEINDTSGEPTKHLNELVEQLEQKERATKSRSLDVIKVCKAMAADGDAYQTSEHELVDWLDRYAKAHDTTFVALYEANNDIGLAIRKAITIAKTAQFVSRTSTLSKAVEGMPGRATLQPRVTGGRAAGAVDNPKSALEELQSLVDQQRAQNPALSESEAWLRVYEHPTNRALALREREENRPVAWG